MATGMIQACLNGRRTRDEWSWIPLTPEDLARDARFRRIAQRIHKRGPRGAIRCHFVFKAVHGHE